MAACTSTIARVAAWIPVLGLPVGFIRNHGLNTAAQRAFAEMGDGELSSQLAGRISHIRTQQAHNALAMSVSSLLTGAVLSAIVALGILTGPVGIAVLGGALVLGLVGLITGVIAIRASSEAKQMADKATPAAVPAAAAAADAAAAAVADAAAPAAAV